jgi:hypothetical protein
MLPCQTLQFSDLQPVRALRNHRAVLKVLRCQSLGNDQQVLGHAANHFLRQFGELVLFISDPN